MYRVGAARAAVGYRGAGGNDDAVRGGARRAMRGPESAGAVRAHAARLRQPSKRAGRRRARISSRSVACWTRACRCRIYRTGQLSPLGGPAAAIGPSGRPPEDSGSDTSSGVWSAAKGSVEVPRPSGRRVAGGKRPLAHVVDGRPRRGPLILVGLIERARGRRFAGVWFGHVDQSAPDSSLPQWSHASRELPFIAGLAPGGLC
jgi:hypothetical protein